MGNNPVNCEPMPKEEFIALLKEMRTVLMKKSMQHKEKAVEERLSHFKVDMEKYKLAILNSMQNQMQDIQIYVEEALKEKNASDEKFQASLQAYMQDTECQQALYEMQMAPMDMMAQAQIPEQLTVQKLTEVITFITDIWKVMNVGSDMVQNLVLQMAGFDEAYEKFQINEIHIGAALIKYEEEQDQEFVKARDAWADTMQKFMNIPGQPMGMGMGGGMPGAIPGMPFGGQQQGSKEKPEEQISQE